MVRYSVVGDGDAVEYFYVHPTDGHITLLKSVLETGRSVYRVCTMKSDISSI